MALRLCNITAEQVDHCILRHYDVTRKNCPAQMSGDSEEWAAFQRMVKRLLHPHSAK